MSHRLGYGLRAMGYWSLPVLLATACSANTGEYYEARGTVEVHEIDLAPTVAARVAAVRVDEGATVAAGDTLALLRQIELPASLEAQRAAVAMAEAHLRDLEAGARPQEIRKAEADLAAAQAESERTGRALERARSLVADNAIARQQYDDAVAADRVAREKAEAAREALALARAGSRPQQIQAARAEVARARATLEQLEARAGDLVLTAPVAGVVLGRHAEPGEALAPNVPVLTVGETTRPFVRVFIPQSLVTGLAVGSPVDVVTEDGRRIPARIAAINPKAEFTPRVAMSEQERADLMFGVKVEFLNPADTPHPGLWVTVRVRQSGSAAVRQRDSVR